MLNLDIRGHSIEYHMLLYVVSEGLAAVSRVVADPVPEILIFASKVNLL